MPCHSVPQSARLALSLVMIGSAAAALADEPSATTPVEPVAGSAIAPAPAPVPVPVAAAPVAPAPAPSYPTLKWSGFLKMEFRADLSATPYVPSSRGGNEAGYFPDANKDGVVDSRARGVTWIRRARIIAKGDVSPTLDYAVFANLNAETKILGSAEAHWKPVTWVMVTAGQFKLPIGREAMESSHHNPLLDRSAASETLTPGPAYRDLGVMGAVTCRSFPVTLTSGVVNGAGHNAGDDNNRKDSVARLAAGPVAGASVGVSGTYGWTGSPPRTRQRLGLDAEWSGAGVKVRGEWLVQRDHAKAGLWKRAMGGYGLVGYRTGRWEPVLRAETLDPLTGKSGDRFRAYTAGVNAYVAGDSRVSVNYTLRRDGTRPAMRDLVTAQLQIAF